jgi:tripartite ATP-independent transporter DctM subunit
VRNRRNFPKDTKKYTKDEIFSIAGNGLITLTMPAILLIGILSGIFTPTESGCIAGVYALFLALMIYRNISLDTLIAILKNTAKTCANIFMIIAFATIFAWIMAAEQIPNIIAEFMLGITSNKYLLLFLINIFLLIVGMWMDTGAAIILFAPILGPIMTRIGVHPIHFGVIMLVNLTLGLITPPVGVVLYSACTVGHRKIEGVIRELFPFIIVGILVLVLVTYFPETVLLLPRLAGFL